MLNAKLNIAAKCRGGLAFGLPPSAFAGSAFTLIELLVVLSIMGLLAALAVPALKNFGRADAMTAADQQMLYDVARARQLAISQRTTVYMVFVPANFFNLPCAYNYNSYPTLLAGIAAMTRVADRQTALNAVTNLCDKQLTGYTFASYGQLGDQPGQHQWHFLAPWQSLPDGTFITPPKFNLPGSPPFYIQAYNPAVSLHGFATNAFPFPTVNSPVVLLPSIAFNYLGQLTTNGVDPESTHEYIPLARGGVLPAMNPDTRMFQLRPPQVKEVPPGNSTNTYNLIDIDPLTGRVTLREPKIQ